MPSATLGLDIGTTACKGLLLGLDGTVLAEASAPQPEYGPQPGWAEADAGDWWGNACAVTRALLAQVPGVVVRGVGVAGMVPVLLLLDGAGAPIRHSIQQNDARTGAEIAAMQAMRSWRGQAARSASSRSGRACAGCAHTSQRPWRVWRRSAARTTTWPIG
jgi:xylulokinase